MSINDFKTLGIVAEYNPFHNGHEYHIKKAKEITGAKFCVVIMSGNFVQRGEPAIIDKYIRASCALNHGADLVIELPTIYATSSAEIFAQKAVTIFDKLGCIDYLAFGQESTNIENLKLIAQILSNEPDEYKQYLREELKKGENFPTARNNALNKLFDNNCDINDISSPNNILAIEYLKALYKLDSNIIPIGIKRMGMDYNDNDILSQEIYASALSIRKQINNASLENLNCYIPDKAYELLTKEFSLKHGPVIITDFDHILHYKLISEASAGFQDYADVSGDLSDRIKNNVSEYISFTDFCNRLKTKNITYSHISRGLIHIILGIKSNLFMQDNTEYASILGFRQEAAPLLSKIKKNTDIPLISKLSKSSSILSKDSQAIFEIDINASEIYNSIILSKYNNKMSNSFKKSPIKI